jgi:hypothetical protein
MIDLYLALDYWKCSENTKILESIFTVCGNNSFAVVGVCEAAPTTL